MKAPNYEAMAQANRLRWSKIQEERMTPKPSLYIEPEPIVERPSKFWGIDYKANPTVKFAEEPILDTVWQKVKWYSYNIFVYSASTVVIAFVLYALLTGGSDVGYSNGVPFMLQ